MGQLIIIVAMFALLWLLFIRPQARRRQAQQQLLSSIDVGDEVLTVGGMYGRVISLGDEDDLQLEIAPGTRVRVARRAVATIVPPDNDLAQLEPVDANPR